MKAKLKLPLRVVLYQEEGKWFAHCLEFNVLGDGGTQAEALQCLATTIGVHIDACARHNALKSLFRPADGKYFQMFAAGNRISVGELVWEQSDQVQIETFDAREFRESTAHKAELVAV